MSEHGFISMVEDLQDATILQVRGRDPHDIAAHFPEAHVYIANGGDYRYRARVSRSTIADRLADMVLAIAYQGHFKDHAVLTSPPNPARLGALYGCWTALTELQDYRPYSTIPRAQERGWRWDEEEDL